MNFSRNFGSKSKLVQGIYFASSGKRGVTALSVPVDVTETSLTLPFKCSMLLFPGILKAPGNEYQRGRLAHAKVINLRNAPPLLHEFMTAGQCHSKFSDPIRHLSVER